jgi:hypothetical protein
MTAEGDVRTDTIAHAERDDADLQIDDPLTLVTRLQELAAAARDPIDDQRARRVYLALLNGNTRTYRAEMNRLVGRYIEKLEAAWTT